MDLNVMLNMCPKRKQNKENIEDLKELFSSHEMKGKMLVY